MGAGRSSFYVGDRGSPDRGRSRSPTDRGLPDRAHGHPIIPTSDGVGGWWGDGRDGFPVVLQAVRARPMFFSLWAFGLLVAAFAGGLPVDEASAEAYSLKRQHSEAVENNDLRRALEKLREDEDRAYDAKGWFGACDAKCVRARDKVQFSRMEAERLEAKRDTILAEGRREVGIWSPFGVQDVRDAFWSAWKSGKDFAARYTTWNAMSFVMRRKFNRDQSLLASIIKLVWQYIMNLTVGLVGSFFYFVYNVYCLLTSYGEPALSGFAFLLLAVVAGMATIAAYIGAMCSVVAGPVFLMKLAALQEEVKEEVKRE